MYENKKHIIKVTGEAGNTLELTVNWDANIFDWIRVFKQILYFLTFSEDLVTEHLKDEYDEDTTYEDNYN